MNNADLKYPGQLLCGPLYNETWFWYYVHPFTEEELVNILAQGESLNLKEATVDSRELKKEVRASSVGWLEDELLKEKIFNICMDANSSLNANWGFYLDYPESLQYTVYNETNKGFYNWHVDGPEENRQTTNHRKLSFVLQLTEPEDYDGGDFQFGVMQNNEFKAVDIDLIKRKGSVIVFPSTAYHRVTPVTRGTRKTLVTWIHGPPWV